MNLEIIFVGSGDMAGTIHAIGRSESGISPESVLALAEWCDTAGLPLDAESLREGITTHGALLVDLEQQLVAKLDEVRALAAAMPKEAA